LGKASAKLADTASICPHGSNSMQYLCVLISAILSSALLAACGGGDPEPAPVPAQVFLDLNANLQKDAGEPETEVMPGESFNLQVEATDILPQQTPTLVVGSVVLPSGGSLTLGNSGGSIALGSGGGIQTGTISLSSTTSATLIGQTAVVGTLTSNGCLVIVSSTGLSTASTAGTARPPGCTK
jgi:hypothetical protein